MGGFGRRGDPLPCIALRMASLTGFGVAPTDQSFCQLLSFFKFFGQQTAHCCVIRYFIIIDVFYYYQRAPKDL